jgi:hypothetical protein
MNIYLQKDFGSEDGRIHFRIPDTHITRPTQPENNKAASHMSIHQIIALVYMCLYGLRFTIDRSK